MSLTKIPVKWPWEPVIVPLDIMTRETWGAQPPTKEVRNKVPAMAVFCYYTKTEPAHTKEEAVKRMRELQQFDLNKKHTDIRYSFVIASDGTAYEGRGWSLLPYIDPFHVEEITSFITIGLLWNRDYERGYCRPIMIKTQEQLIRNGIANNYIHKDFEQFILYY